MDAGLRGASPQEVVRGMSKTRERVALVVAEVFLGLTSVVGMIGILSGGIQFPKEWLHGTPFTDYTVPAICLGVLVGGTSIAAAIALLLGHPVALGLSGAAGLSIIVFELVEVTVTGYAPVGLALQLFYVAVGIVILGLTGALWTASRRTRPASRR
jgi:hypothetical protein